MKVFGFQLFGRNDPAPVRAAMERQRQKVRHCEACGKMPVEVHHVIPVSLDPSKAADPDNLMSLCDDCHLVHGHSGDYRWYVANVREVLMMRKIKRSEP